MPKQRAQKILVYGLPGRCKHLNCRLFQHLTTLPNSYLHEAYLIYSKQTLAINHDSEESVVPNVCVVILRPAFLPVEDCAPGCPQWLNRACPPTPEHHHAADLFCGARMTPIHDSLGQQQRWPQEEEEGSWWQLMEKCATSHQRLLPRLNPQSSILGFSILKNQS